MDGVAILESEVRELIRRRGVDPVRDRAGVVALVHAAMADYDERSLIGSVPQLADTAAAHKAVVDAVAGLGPLQRYLDDDEVEEIWINSPSQVFVARRGEPELTTTILTDAQVRDLVEQMLKVSVVRRFTAAHPGVRWADDSALAVPQGRQAQPTRQARAVRRCRIARRVWRRMRRLERRFDRAVRRLWQ